MAAAPSSTAGATDGYKTGYNQSADAKFRSVLDAVDRLRDVLDGIDGEDFSLPAIAVIGNQSSGKSSILERLSGVDLPRGEGMVTRCALVMRLKTKNVDVPEITIRYGSGEFEPVTADQVANKIRAITDEIAPGGEINADVKIDLQVQSRDVPDLTLIDLPGIAYGDDVGGDGQVVFARIKALYEKYITSESCVMLCVMPANAEMATQQAAAIAKSVDKDMKRTIGVVTKIDTIQDSDGSTIVRRLSGEGAGAWRFTLGCHAVRNRDQKQINEGATRADVDKSEAAFFQTHNELSQAPKQWSADTLGFISLVNKLIDVQFRIISENFPKTEKKIRQKLEEKEIALKNLPAAIQTEAQAANELRKLTGDLRQAFGDLYRVEYGSIIPAEEDPDVNTGEASTEASAHEMEMMPRLQEHLDAFETAVRDGGKHIMTTAFAATARKELARLNGYVVPDLMTHGAVKVLARAEVGNFKEPATDLLYAVHEYFSSLCATLVGRYFANHPALRDHVEAAIGSLLNDSLGLCAARLKEQLTIEMDEVYTLNHYYSDTVAKVLARLEQIEVGDTAETDLELIIEGVYGSSFVFGIAKDSASTSSLVQSICGTFIPTAEMSSGKTVYRKLDDKNIWLEYHEKYPGWFFVETNDRGDSCNNCITVPEKGAVLSTGTWIMDDKSKLTVTMKKPKAVVCHDNLERAVKETQVRLWCYRKVVHKAFCDTIAKYVRYQFPRRLRDQVEEAIHSAVCEPPAEAADDGLSSGSASGLASAGRETSLLLHRMQETSEVSKKRKALEADLKQLKEGLGVVKELKRLR